MIDLYQSNRTQADEHRRKLLSQIASLAEPESFPAIDGDNYQPFYLEFKKRLQAVVQQETDLLKKELQTCENSHLILLKHTALVDAVIQIAFDLALWLAGRNHAEPLQSNDIPVAIVARGGYGREEMYFCSDVDLQTISRNNISEEEKKLAYQVINAFDYLFVYQDIFRTSSSSGYSEVDTGELEFSEMQLASFYSLMEHRLVAGNPQVYAEFKSSIRTATLLHREAILRHCFKHKSYYEIQNTVFRQEPNIKEELRRLYWATSLVRIRESLQPINQFELLSELYNRGKLSSMAFKSMQNGLNFLSRVRMFLHCYQKGTQRDTLSYEVREKIAEMMGYKNQVKEFFREYYFHAVLPLKRYSRNLFWETMTFSTDKVRRLSEHFALNSENQIVFVNGSRDFTWDPPVSILDLFTWVARKNYFLSFPVIRAIERNIEQMMPLFQGPEEKQVIQTSFQNIIRGRYFAKTLRYLHEFHLLEHYFIPEFKNLSGLLQDIYVHMFPTDIHILAALDELNKFELSSDIDPFLKELYESLKDKTTLKLAVLLHDIGKGLKTHGENEELVGARTVPRILENLGYGKNSRVINDVAFLVEKHLMMHDLMLLDPDDDETYEMIWDLVNGDVERLKMLILLTYADRAGTKMKMSKSQIDQLKYFYQNTLHHKKRESVPMPVKMEFLKMIRLPRDLQAQLQVYQEFKKSPEKFAAELFFKPDQPSELVVCAKDQRALLYNIATVLAFNQLSIVEANIHTLKDNVFDVFKICDVQGKSIQFSNFFFIQKQIKDSLYKIFVEEVPVATLYKGRSLITKVEERKYRDVKLKLAIIGRTVKIETHDIIGTVMMETKVFSQMNMPIERAVIHTNHGTASNVFYLREEDVRAIMREEERFKRSLLKALQPLTHSEPIFPVEPAHTS